MTEPEPPRSLPKYLAERIPKQDVNILCDIRDYVDALIEYRKQPVNTNELPDTAEPIDRDGDGNGTVVKEKVRCGDETCKCASGAPADLHGPYLYRYYREAGELTSEYLGKP
jgi:hypothetical protein